MIRWAKKSEIGKVKQLIDSFEEMDIITETFPKKYYERIIKKGILLISEEDNKIVGVCFGTYNVKEKWADLLGLVVAPDFRNKGIGSLLVKEFESFVKKIKLSTIDLYADRKQLQLFRNLNYKEGRTYIAFRKKI